jgi:hypothetical protein
VMNGLALPGVRASLYRCTSPYLGRLADGSSPDQSFISVMALETFNSCALVPLLEQATKNDSGALQISVIAVAMGISYLITVRSLAFEAIALGSYVVLMLAGAVVGAVCHAIGCDYVLDLANQQILGPERPAVAAV